MLSWVDSNCISVIEGATSGKIGSWLLFSFCGGSEGDRNEEAVGATVGQRDVPTGDVAGSEVGVAVGATVGAKLAYNNGAFEDPEIAGEVVGATVGKETGTCKPTEVGR